MKIETHTLCLIKRLADCLDMGIVTKIHQTAPIVELNTILENGLRCYECQLIPILKTVESVKETIKNLSIDPSIIKRIKAREKFSALEIHKIQEEINLILEPLEDNKNET